MALLTFFEGRTVGLPLFHDRGGRSAAAAGRATTRSWRSLPERSRPTSRSSSRGEVIAGKFLNPELGRQKPEHLVAAMLELALLRP
jgi:phosphoenolpyruvate carboxylase